jgi:lipopolysaccharide transport system permease protein
MATGMATGMGMEERKMDMVTTQKVKPEEDDHEWDLEIRPKPHLLNLNLKEVWRYRDLLVLFVRRDFVAQYKQTILGPVWHFIQPILTTIIYLFIFGRVAKLPTDGIHPVLFFISGISLWNYFSVCLNTTSFAFHSNAAIFGKVYFPRIIMPLTVIISNLIRFGIQMLLIFSAMTWYYFHGEPVRITIAILYIPVILVLMAGIALGLGIIVSSVTTKYKDLNVLMSFAVQLGMFATPIVYPLSFLNDSGYSWLIRLNPLTPLVEAFRYALFQRGTFTATDLLYSAGFMIVVLLTGLIMFNKVEKTFMDTV